VVKVEKDIVSILESINANLETIAKNLSDISAKTKVISIDDAKSTNIEEFVKEIELNLAKAFENKMHSR
jgi:hypothetical protein